MNIPKVSKEEELRDLEQDVEDYKKGVVFAEQEVKNAVEWHQNRLERYANAIKALDKFKKEKGL